MKGIVFLRAFGAPLLLGILLPIKLSYNTKSFETFLDITFFAAVLLSALLSESRYLKGFHEEDSRLVMHYLTPFLQERTTGLQLEAIEKVKLSKWKQVNLWLPAFQVKTPGEWNIFKVPSKQVYDQLQSHLQDKRLSLVK